MVASTQADGIYTNQGPDKEFSVWSVKMMTVIFCGEQDCEISLSLFLSASY